MLGLERTALMQEAARELGAPLDEHDADRVAVEQMRMLLSHTRLGTLVATAFALFGAMHDVAAASRWSSCRPGWR